MTTPIISVVIPTFNRHQSLTRTLEGLAAQVDPGVPFEVIVVSDGSTDGTDDFLASRATPVPVVAVSQRNAGPAAARNQGVAKASGTMILFIDDDTVPDRRLLVAHLECHEHPDDDLVVLGPMNTPPDHAMSPWIAWEQAHLESQYEDIRLGVYAPTARQFYTGNASVARRHLEAVGGFDPSFRRAEDVELAYRLAGAGVRFQFAPEAIVLHYAERSVDAWLQAARDYGRNDVVISRDHGQGWLLEAVGREYWTRHRLVRTAARIVLPRPKIAAKAPAMLTRIGSIAFRVRLKSVAEAALSGAFNLAYYDGTTDELGGAAAFRALVLGAKEAGR